MKSILSLLVCALAALPAFAGGETITIGTLNIANFGATSEYERSLICLTNILRRMDADLIALQEVEPNDLGADQLERLVRFMNMAADFYEEPPYQYVASEKGAGDELTAYLWRAPVKLESAPTPLPHAADADDDGLRAFQRTPSVALFSAGAFDFYVVNCHLYTKLEGVSSEGRAEELRALRRYLEALPGGSERDAIVLGDFNRHLNGRDAWEELMAAGHESCFRFPLLEAIAAECPGFDPLRDDAPEDCHSTTTSKKRSIYDQVLIAAGTYREFGGEARLGVNVGIVDFDNDPDYEWVVDSWHTAIKTLTDHRPVWIRLRLPEEDDDR